MGPFLFAAYFTFFLGGSQNTYWHHLLLLLLSFGVFTGRALAGGIIYLFISILFSTYLISTCFTGFLIAPYLLPTSCSEDRRIQNRTLEYLVFLIGEKGLNSCIFLSGDLLLRIIVAFALSRDSCCQYKQDRAL